MQIKTKDFPKLLLIFSILLAIFFRFYRLSAIPTGFLNDEAAVGYNAYSILKTGKDEFGQSWPLIFTSFGEGKLPLYVYPTVPAIALLGLNEFAVRFPGALFGILSVWLIYFLTQAILDFCFKKPYRKETKFFYQWLPAFSSLLLAITPWHIFLSRGVFDQGSLFWIILGAWLSLSAIKKNLFKPWLLSQFAFAAAIFTYHSARIFVPLWLFYLLYYQFRRRGLKVIGKLALAAFLISGSAWLVISLNPRGLTRAKAVSVFSYYSGVSLKLQQDIVESKGEPLIYTRLLHNKLEAYTREILSGYLSHFQWDYLFFSGEPVRLRYRIPNLGQLLLVTAPFFFLGFYPLLRKKLWPIIIFLLIAPISAALSYETPSSVRAFYLVVPLVIITALGFAQALYLWQQQQLVLKLLLAGFVLLALVYNLIYFQDAYFVHAQKRDPYYSDYGYKKLVQKVSQLAPHYQRVEVTDKRGSPYIFFLFFSQYDPTRWQTEAHSAVTGQDEFGFLGIDRVGPIHFFSETCPSHDIEPDVLYVCTGEDNPPAPLRSIDEVKYLNGHNAFVLKEKITAN
jgi:4-amino-4-deoxy-L-arabinose transferase-like glycosyltransferase